MGNSSDTYQGEREEKGAKNNNRESSEANNEKKRGEKEAKGRQFLVSYVNTASDVLFFPRARDRGRVLLPNNLPNRAGALLA